MDPNFQAGVRSYVNEAGKRAGEVGYSANTWAKHTLGVDVAEGVSGVVGTVRDRVGGGPQRQGYGFVQQHGGMDETSALYQDEDEFFDSFETAQPAGHSAVPSQPARNSLTSRSSTAAAAKKDDDWDEWKDF